MIENKDRTAEEAERNADNAVYQTVFNNEYGKAVLTDMLNELGFFSSNASMVNPEKIAFANWLLGRIGILTVKNLHHYVDGMMNAVTIINKEKR